MDTKNDNIDTTSTLEAAVGHADGEVLENGETVVYDYDDNNQFTGWHKAPRTK